MVPLQCFAGVPSFLPTFLQNQGLKQEPSGSQPRPLVLAMTAPLSIQFSTYLYLCVALRLLPFEFAVMDILW